MGDKSAIEWTDATWNPVTGCTRVSAGCDNCYAARQAATRLSSTPQYEGLATVTASGRAAFNGRIRLLADRLDQPLRWRKPRMVFVNSMSDLFHDRVPDGFIDRVFAVMALAQAHTFQVLTKRPYRMLEYLCEFVANQVPRLLPLFREFGADDALIETIPTQPLPNVWIGVSVEDQDAYDERVPLLLETPATVRWLSVEPQLGPVHLRDRVDWVVIGGESGPGARPFNFWWARNLMRVCRRTQVPVFMKQIGAQPIEEVVSPKQYPGNLPTIGVWVDGMGETRQAKVLGRVGGRYTLAWPSKEPKGADQTEWPQGLRVREWPAALKPR